MRDDKQATVTIDKATFRNNIGTALDICNATGTIEGSTFDNNIDMDYMDSADKGVGGAILIREPSEIEINKCIITNNKAKHGGGIYITDTSKVQINETSITGNQAKEGGGVYVKYSQLQIHGGSIQENKANKGGGIYLRSNLTAKLDITGTTIKGNEATKEEHTGGAGAVIYAEDNFPNNHEITITDCEITENKGESYNSYHSFGDVISVEGGLN